LYRNGDTVTSCSSLAEIIVLEVERGLGKSILVRNIVDSIDDVKSVNSCGVQVTGGSRVLVRVLGIDEIERTR
jgi:hypothetical protein